MELQEVLIVLIIAVILTTIVVHNVMSTTESAASSSTTSSLTVSATYGGPLLGNHVINLKFTVIGSVPVRVVRLLAVTPTGNCTANRFSPGVIEPGTFDGYAIFSCDPVPGSELLITYCIGDECNTIEVEVGEAE